MTTHERDEDRLYCPGVVTDCLVMVAMGLFAFAVLYGTCLGCAARAR